MHTLVTLLYMNTQTHTHTDTHRHRQTHTDPVLQWSSDSQNPSLALGLNCLTAMLLCTQSLTFCFFLLLLIVRYTKPIHTTIYRIIHANKEETYWCVLSCIEISIHANMHTWFHWYTFIELTISTVYSLQFSIIMLYLTLLQNYQFRILQTHYCVQCLALLLHHLSQMKK